MEAPSSSLTASSLLKLVNPRIVIVAVRQSYGAIAEGLRDIQLFLLSFGFLYWTDTCFHRFIHVSTRRLAWEEVQVLYLCSKIIP